MKNIKRKTLSALYAFKTRLSATKLRLGKKLGLIRSVMIIPYSGFGNSNEIFFMGRVLRDRGVGLSKLEDSKWRNFGRMYKRFMTWEIPFVRVNASINSVSETTVTDEEGYFRFNIRLNDDQQVLTPRKDVRLELLDSIIENKAKVKARCKVYIASPDSGYGIISDIDDTVVPTGSTRVQEMLRTTFFRNAHTRIPFPGLASFYQALKKGPDGHGSNPFFYVSSSPWNLYDFLIELMDIHDIPKGPLLLRDLGLTRERLFSGTHTEHKLMQVERIFRIIKDLPFILIGDSSQHDAEIYLQVIKDFPGRVKMVYIRDVSAANHSKVIKIADEVRKHDVEMLLVRHTKEAAEHALSRRWITENTVTIPPGEKEDDEDGF